MIKIGILGDIGSGKTFVANYFGYPVFNADIEVSKIYKNNKSCFKILKKNFPNHIFSFPINKKEISKLILSNKKNLKNLFKDLEIVEWGGRIDFDMIINATSIGLKNENDLNFDYSANGPDKYFYDVIYNPKETLFLKRAKLFGNKTENGKMMFIYQAHQSFTIWNKIMPKIDDQTIKLI